MFWAVVRILYDIAEEARALVRILRSSQVGLNGHAPQVEKIKDG